MQCKGMAVKHSKPFGYRFLIVCEVHEVEASCHIKERLMFSLCSSLLCDLEGRASNFGHWTQGDGRPDWRDEAVACSWVYASNARAWNAAQMAVLLNCIILYHPCIRALQVTVALLQCLANQSSFGPCVFIQTFLRFIPSTPLDEQ